MKFLAMLLFLLAASVAFGLIRKLRGGTFFPQPAPDEDQVIRAKDGRWWRHEPNTGAWEEAFKRPRKKQ